MTGEPPGRGQPSLQPALSFAFVLALFVSMVGLCGAGSIWTFSIFIGLAALCLVAAFNRLSRRLPNHTFVTLAAMTIGGLLALVSDGWSIFFLIEMPGDPIRAIWILGLPPLLFGLFLIFLGMKAARE
jgi:hypothetical protein